MTKSQRAEYDNFLRTCCLFTLLQQAEINFRVASTMEVTESSRHRLRHSTTPGRSFTIEVERMQEAVRDQTLSSAKLSGSSARPRGSK